MYTQIFFTISVLGMGLFPTTLASASLSVRRAINAALGLRADFFLAAFFTAFLGAFFATFFTAFLAAFFTTFLAAFFTGFFAAFLLLCHKRNYLMGKQIVSILKSRILENTLGFFHFFYFYWFSQ